MGKSVNNIPIPTPESELSTCIYRFCVNMGEEVPPMTYQEFRGKILAAIVEAATREVDRYLSTARVEEDTRLFKEDDIIPK